MFAKMTVQQKMPAEESVTDEVMSQLSALADEELEDSGLDLALRRLLRDRELQERWERYHLISDTLQGHLPDAFDTGFSARIRQAIESEPAFSNVAKPLPTWYKPVTGFGVAASVVLVSLFGFRQLQTDTPIQPMQPVFSAMIPASALSSAASRVTPASADDQRPDNAQEVIVSRLNSYLVDHNSHASANGVNGVLPYVRMVGYQTNR